MRHAAYQVAGCLAVGLGLLAGCRSGGIPLLNLLPSGKSTTVIGLAADPKPLFSDDKIDPINPLERFEPLRKSAQADLGHAVLLDLCLELQLSPNLNLGMYQFVLLTPAQYSRLPEREKYSLLASSIDAGGRASRSAVLVVSATASMKRVDELRGKIVGFGPEREMRGHAAGLRLLEDNGLKRTDLSLEALPVPGSLKVFPNGRAIAQSVINGSSDAGFVDEAYLESLPETAVDKAEPARDKLRVIGKTAASPDWVVIAGLKVDAAAQAKFKAFLLKVGQQSPDALSKLSLRGFGEPPADLTPKTAAGH